MDLNKVSSFIIIGFLRGSRAFLPPTMESIPPNCELSIDSVKPSKILL